ncbi:MAG: hypothetical protein ACYTHM_01195 [Planctomycetota bacterium]|jgi:hypothetical protein
MRLSAYLSLGILFASWSFGLPLWASGNDCSFDEAAKAAKGIVIGKVVDEWTPKGKGRNTPDDAEDVKRWRIYRVQVSEVFRGRWRKGGKVVIGDRHHLSSASFFINEKKENLIFFTPAKLTPFQRKTVDFGTKNLFEPVRNISQDSDPEEYAGWLFLLKFVLKDPPKDLTQAYRDLLGRERNRYVLRYVLEHFPKKMTEADEALFRSIIQKFADDAYITSPAIDRLASRGKGFEDMKLAKLLKDGSPYQRDDLLKMVTFDNIDSVKDILFGWLLEEEPEPEQQTIEKLASLCPDFLKGKLKEMDWPFWKVIPCLQELKINGSAVGKKDYPPEILRLSPYLIRNVGQLFQGNDFHAEGALKHPQWNQKWVGALPLMDPLLEKPDGPIRRIAVAVMRTYGRTLKREGEKYVVVPGDGPAKPPIRIQAVATKETYRMRKPIKFSLEEIAQTPGVWFAFRGQWLWCVTDLKSKSSTSSGTAGSFEKVNIPKEEYVQLTKGKVVRSKLDLRDYVEAPGKYKIEFKRIYHHDGGSVGLDAWTGAVYAKPIVIVVR